MELLDYVAAEIKNLRMTYRGGEGISQEAPPNRNFLELNLSVVLPSC